MQTLDVLNSLPRSMAPVMIVNECYPTQEKDEIVRRERTLEIFKKQYPQHCFYQKTSGQEGQAASLNLILTELEKSKAAFWFHMEESWFLDPTTLFDGTFNIDRFLHIMKTCPLAQLQLSDIHWKDLPPDVYVDQQKQYVLQHDLLVVPYPKMLQQLKAEGHSMKEQSDQYGGLGHIWPCYSLLPSLTRADTVVKLRFPENMELWPVKFEFEFAVKWCRGIEERHLYKAVFKNAQFFIRKQGHVSTYLH